MNIAILSGHLGRDPELRSVNGDQVLSFSIGVSVGPRDSQETMWVDCSIWGKRATGLRALPRQGHEGHGVWSHQAGRVHHQGWGNQNPA
jgi:single-stranded DNA-binding protein